MPRWLVTAAVVVAAAMAVASPHAQPGTVDNTQPRTDVSGEIVNAHGGHITSFKRNGEWRYYWVGSAWVPCAPPPGNGTCVDGTTPVVRNGTTECLEPKENGCLSMA